MPDAAQIGTAWCPLVNVTPLAKSPQWTTAYASFGTGNATALRRVGLELSESNRKIPARFKHHEHDQLAKIADVSADWIEFWFLQTENWVSVVTGEDINHRQPVFDANMNGPGLQTWRHGGKTEASASRPLGRNHYLRRFSMQFSIVSGMASNRRSNTSCGGTAEPPSFVATPEKLSSTQRRRWKCVSLRWWLRPSCCWEINTPAGPG